MSIGIFVYNYRVLTQGNNRVTALSLHILEDDSKLCDKNIISQRVKIIDRVTNEDMALHTPIFFHELILLYHN